MDEKRALVSAEHTAQAIERQRLNQQTRAYVEDSKVASTRRAYRSDWVDFLTWCEGRASSRFRPRPTPSRVT